jgi:hypothetical protein
MRCLSSSGVFAIDCKVLNDREIEIGYLFVGLDNCFGTWQKLVNPEDLSQSFMIKMPKNPPTTRVILEYCNEQPPF